MNLILNLISGEKKLTDIGISNIQILNLYFKIVMNIFYIMKLMHLKMLFYMMKELLVIILLINSVKYYIVQLY